MLIIRACWTQFGLLRFQKEVNAELAKGRKIESVHVNFGPFGLRVIMMAVLSVSMDPLPKL